MTEQALIEVEGLRVERGLFTLEIPSWRLMPGEVLGIVGPNGAGKSTLLEILGGFQPASAGKVNVLGQVPWRAVSEVRLRLGFMNESYPLPNLNIGALLTMVSGFYPTWDEALVSTLLDVFGLCLDQKSTELSKGQGTRLRLLLAMAFRPKVLVLDEPASGLDLGGRRSLLQSVLGVVQDPERSVIISSHLLSDLERIADRLLVLDDGKVIKEGATDELVGEQRTLEEALFSWGAAGAPASAR